MTDKLPRKQETAMRHNYEKYVREIDKKINKNQLREGIVKLGFKDYIAQYNIYAVIADNIESSVRGEVITANDLMLSNSSRYEEPFVRAIWRIVEFHGYKTSLDVVRENIERYNEMVHDWYPDPEDYDRAISNASGW